MVNEDPDRDPSSRPTMLHRQQLRVVAPHIRGAMLVDVGCGSGGFLYHAIRRGASPRSYGIELSGPSRRAAQRAGLRVVEAMDELEDPAVVTMWHSAEHFAVDELVALWIDVRDRGSAATRMVVSVPNGDSVQWRVFHERWAYSDPDAHHSQFSRRSLDALAQRAGWRVAEECRTPVYGAFGALQSALNLLRPHNELYLAAKRAAGPLSRGVLVANAAAAVATAPLTATVGAAEAFRQHASVLTWVLAPR